MFDLTGKTILVTGGLGVMGRKLSLALAARGYRTRVLCLPAEAATPSASTWKSPTSGNSVPIANRPCYLTPGAYPELVESAT